MFKKMLIASELFKGEFDIIRCIRDFKLLGTEECLLLQCLNKYEGKATISSFFEHVLEENLREQKKKLIESGYLASTRIISGDIKHEINRIAKEEEYSLIVVGAAEHSLMGELFFGGAAHELIHHASKPILLVRVSDNPDEVCNRAEKCNITDHVLFPTDFSDNAAVAFEYVKKMAEEGVKRITLVHVQDKSRIEPYLSDRVGEFAERDMKLLEEMKRELLDEGKAEVDIKLLYGSPTAELLRFIQELKITMVVMGSQGRSMLEEIRLGSLSHNIARHSAASVLLIPAKKD